jgi:hypothetical protein
VAAARVRLSLLSRAKTMPARRSPNQLWRIATFGKSASRAGSVVDLGVAGRDRWPRPLPFDEPARGRADDGPDMTCSEQLPQTHGEVEDIVGLKQKPGAIVLDQLPMPADVRGEDYLG